MAVNCPQFSYTKPRRLPKKMSRPSNTAFRAAAAQLDRINRKAGGIPIPAIVEVFSDEEIDPGTEYEMAEYAAQKALGRECDLTNEDLIEGNTNTSGNNSRSAVSKRKRTFVVESDDDEEDPSSTPSSPSSEDNRQRERLNRPHGRDAKPQQDSFLSGSDGADEQPVRRVKKPRQGLAAELDDLDIDMEGWSAEEDAPRKLRRGR